RVAYQQAIDSGHPNWAPRAMIGLGLFLAYQGDIAGARMAYQQAIDSGHPNAAPLAMVGLSPVLAVEGQTNGAHVLLRLAARAGNPRADDYAAVLDDDPRVRERARASLNILADGGDTDALNFLGVAAWREGARDEARALWRRSHDARNVTAPLLLGAKE
ncbi:MAG TPA: hypothetical protein VK887_15730, partial [Pseudonocardiaceae bacterium]|nr:hypothetical protein [Pseudonocardiaceae bacterium]